MDLSGLAEYAAGVVTGTAGTALLNHCLSVRRDERQAERQRLAEGRAEDRERRAGHRSRQLARLEIIRAGALELRELVDEHAGRGVHYDRDDPSKGYWIEFFEGLERRRDGEVERALSELCDDEATRLYSAFDLASFEHGSRLARDEDPVDQMKLWKQYQEAYDELVAALNEVERRL